MACFIIPAAEAVIVAAAAKILEKKEEAVIEKEGFVLTEPFSCKLKRLNRLLCGGSGILIFEHLWHGEIQPSFPFLTAINNPSDIAEMVHEMSTVGVAMSLFVTAVWSILTYTTEKNKQRNYSAIVKDGANP